MPRAFGELVYDLLCEFALYGVPDGRRRVGGDRVVWYVHGGRGRWGGSVRQDWEAKIYIVQEKFGLYGVEARSGLARNVGAGSDNCRERADAANY